MTNNVEAITKVNDIWKNNSSVKTKYIQITEIIEGDRIRYKGFAKPLWEGTSRFARNSTMACTSLISNYTKLTDEEVSECRQEASRRINRHRTPQTTADTDDKEDAVDDDKPAGFSISQRELIREEMRLMIREEIRLMIREEMGSMIREEMKLMKEELFEELKKFFLS